MYSFKLHTLGCGSAKPTARHQPSSTVLEHRGTLYMIDCGEGAQRNFQIQHLKFSRLRHIFLTHLHGDHVLGLPGLISTMGLGGNGGKITIHTFEEGKNILSEMIDFFSPQLSFELEFDVIKPEEKIILETPSLIVRTVPLRHRVPTVGYIFEEKNGPRHIIRDMIDFHQVPVASIRDIKEGADYVKPDGSVIPNAMLTRPGTPGKKYAHISDTMYIPSLANKIGPVDLLLHETTYLMSDEGKARERFHSTAAQAASVARDAGAKLLLTSHYSSSIKDENLILNEAKEIFPNSMLNYEGLTLTV